MTKIVAQRGDEWFLVHVRGEGLDARGFIYNSRTGVRHPEANFQTLLAQGYWETPDLSESERRRLQSVVS